MMFFGNITASDWVTFEGFTVSKITPIQNKKSKEVTHFRLSVEDAAGDIQLRKFRVEEVPHLFDTERLVVHKGYHSLAQQQDRILYGGRDLFGATKAQRDRIDLIMFLNRLMERYHKLGMKLTRESVHSFRQMMTADFENYQARKIYGTEAANASQSLKRLPSADTLLTRYRKLRKSGGNPNVFLAQRVEKIDTEIQASADFCFVMERLGGYASPECPSKAKIIGKLIDELERLNAERVAAGIKVLFRIYCQKTYERWIDQYLDPFLVCMQREGWAEAQKQFGTVEDGVTASDPGEEVQGDAWQFHLVTLDTTREQYNQMTEEERKAVKRVRRWVTTLIDVATRCILGFSISRSPNEQASLEALRMAFMNKTYLFRDIGITGAEWDYCCPIQQVSNDNGTEYGRDPFGGAAFSQAVRHLAVSHMNTVAGVSSLRGHMEHFFWTCDLKWARYLPGYTANNPQNRNDRKPGEEACITDDELQAMFVAFIAEYHNTPHRGLNFRTPAAVWDELTEGQTYDYGQMPSASQLREACGFYTDASVGEAGIRYAGAVYSNEYTRNQRKARLVDRIAKPGEKVEIKVDPFDLGAITVLAKGEMISVGALDPQMHGKSLRQWQTEKLIRKQQTEAENLSRKGARDEACNLWEKMASSIAQNADVGMSGYSQAEIDRAALELGFGKGQHEKPYIGRDEYVDPVHGGFEIGGGEFVEEDPLREEAEPDTPTSMDRFRSAARNRKRKKKPELE